MLEETRLMERAMALPDSSSRPPVQPARSVVVPQKPGRLRKILATVVYVLIRTIAFTVRFRWEYAPGVLESKTRPLIFCIWHNRLALSLLMHEDFAQKIGQKRRLAAMVSASRDGGVLARVLEHFKVQPVRGSSSRRGPQALLELRSWAEQGYDLAITPDGPRGPKYVVQHGVISLAQLTGCPIVPASQRLAWKYTLGSWDGFQVPLPFTRAVMKFGEPLSIPREASEEERAKLRAELERRLNELTRD